MAWVESKSSSLMPILCFILGVQFVSFIRDTGTRRRATLPQPLYTFINIRIRYRLAEPLPRLRTNGTYNFILNNKSHLWFLFLFVVVEKTTKTAAHEGCQLTRAAEWERERKDWRCVRQQTKAIYLHSISPQFRYGNGFFFISRQLVFRFGTIFERRTLFGLAIYGYNEGWLWQIGANADSTKCTLYPVIATIVWLCWK